MTIIFAAALADAAILGSDGRRSNLTTGQVEAFDKTLQISPTIAAAKFGYGGPEADVVWERVRNLPPLDLEDIEGLLPKIQPLGAAVYEQQRALFAAHGQPDWGMTLIFASYDERGAGIHWIDYRDGEGKPNSAWRRNSATEMVIAKGPPGSDRVAIDAMARSLRDDPRHSTIAPRRWAQDVVEAAGSLSSTIGPPAFVRVISAAGQIHSTITPHELVSNSIRYQL